MDHVDAHNLPYWLTYNNYTNSCFMDGRYYWCGKVSREKGDDGNDNDNDIIHVQKPLPK